MACSLLVFLVMARLDATVYHITVGGDDRPFDPKRMRQMHPARQINLFERIRRISERARYGGTSFSARRSRVWASSGP